MSGKRVIAVDLGGTKILAGIVDADGRAHEKIERPTVTTSQAALLDELEQAVRSLPQDGVVAVGLGVPARIDYRRGVAIAAVNIPLNEIALIDEMERRLGLPVGMENDGTCAAYAEYTHGAGRGAHSLVALTLGTGVGGGVVLDGRVLRAWTELGHVVIVADGEPCYGACTGRGHVEAYCSGTAANRIAVRELGPGASARDLVALRHPALEELGHHLGVAIGSIANIFGCDRVVVGGGFGVAAAGLLLPPARAAVRREALSPLSESLELEVAQLGADAGLLGAALVAFDAAAAAGVAAT